MQTPRINPFHLRPHIKNMLRKPKHVEIPENMCSEFQDKLMNLQNSLDYMATNYNINFKIIHWPFKIEGRELSIDKVTCQKNDNISDTELMHIDRDDEADIARNVYMAASNVLESKKQKSAKKSHGVITQNIPDILKPTYKIYSGILEYYAKKYDGMTFTVTGINGENSIVNENPPKIIINCNYNSKSASTSISKVDNAVHTSEANAFYTRSSGYSYNLNDFYEDKKYEDIYKMINEVLEPNS